MNTLIILLTSEIKAAIDNKEVCLEVDRIFGNETIVVDKQLIDGKSAVVSGEPEEFRKLVHVVGDVWTSTNPMLGEWQQITKDEEETVVENNS